MPRNIRKLFKPLSPKVQFGTGQWAVMLFGWEGNRGPGGSNGSLGYRQIYE